MKATIRSIAREANVSPATVSRVLGGSTQVTPHMRSHVLNIARKLGYHSAGIRNVALIAGESFYSGYDALLLQALREELRHRNYRAVLVTTSDLGALDDCVIAGAISIAYQDGREKLWIRNRALPMICINTTGYHLDGIYKVYSDEQQGIELALEHFYKFGHRNLGLVTYCSNLPGPVSAQPAPSGFEADSVVCSSTNRNNGRTAWDGKDEIIGRRNCQNIGTAA